MNEHTFYAGGIEWRVRREDTGSALPPVVHCRIAGHERWVPESSTWFRHLAGFAADMEARANEYHDTTMKQAKRLAMLEEAVESHQMRILELERILTPEQRELIPCPCGGGPDHGPDWCADFT